MTATKEPASAAGVKSTIEAFFDAINAEDTKALQARFHPKAGLTIIRQDPPLPPDGSRTPTPDSRISAVNTFSIEQFIALIEEGQKQRKGKPGPKLHEAPALSETQVTVDALFATAVSPFTVTFDGVLHHYGQMIFNFWKESEKTDWRIQSVTQNYRRTPGWETESTQ
ncbi:unnamed protein product [Zymoseptoria tritici ST99CH_1A5]|uniref:SnoaL-like domain-containing protein n=2 Tax=Zymoseptoria tritici TaxID=1047171 RepID=A0A2H1FKN7_ZYMTR|nr:unnamed protein product [Zymoseptoria tritici ST99CH_1E4]SMY19238.1 unnamed protein product [Zymoseptoria tritici ST99CH_1A5]